MGLGVSIVDIDTDPFFYLSLMYHELLTFLLIFTLLLLMDNGTFTKNKV